MDKLPSMDSQKTTNSDSRASQGSDMTMVAVQPFGSSKLTGKSTTGVSSSETLTLQSGAPHGDKFNSLLVGQLGPNLLADAAYLEETAHFNRERIPERVVHAKGAAAFGSFTVTNKEICNYTKASLFSAPGKRTPVVVRFSQVAGESGSADTLRDFRGFAVKFYTEQGNWDLVGNNFPVFFIRDPINFTSFIHTQKRDPKTHLKNPDAFWDFITLKPESLHALLMRFSDRGIPDGYRHMHGYGVNTFLLVNAAGEQHFAKFHWICQQKIRSLEPDVAERVAGRDPDFAMRDLWYNIERKNYPQWVLKVQLVPVAEAHRTKFNLFDVTKVWPQAEFPLIEVGRLKLDKNPENYFAQVEQLAFSPANMVPGIEPSPDKMLVGRMFAYPDAQNYRLGVNHANLPCNFARCPVLTPTYCDGLMYMPTVGAAKQPNYVPSSQLRKQSLVCERFQASSLTVAGQTGRFDLSDDDNYTQPRMLLNKVMTTDFRERLARNIAHHLRQVRDPEIVARALAHFSKIDAEFSRAVEQKINGMGMSSRSRSNSRSSTSSRRRTPKAATQQLGSESKSPGLL